MDDGGWDAFLSPTGARETNDAVFRKGLKADHLPRLARDEHPQSFSSTLPVVCMCPGVGEAPVGRHTGNAIFCTPWSFLGTPSAAVPGAFYFWSFYCVCPEPVLAEDRLSSEVIAAVFCSRLQIGGDRYASGCPVQRSARRRRHCASPGQVAAWACESHKAITARAAPAAVAWCVPAASKGSEAVMRDCITTPLLAVCETEACSVHCAVCSV